MKQIVHEYMKQLRGYNRFHRKMVLKAISCQLKRTKQTIKGIINTLTANYEYCRNNADDLPLPVQMEVSGKLKTFSGFFIAFFESTLNFEHFEKKISLIAQVFLKLYTPKDVFT